MTSVRARGAVSHDHAGLIGVTDPTGEDKKIRPRKPLRLPTPGEIWPSSSVYRMVITDYDVAAQDITEWFKLRMADRRDGHCGGEIPGSSAVSCRGWHHDWPVPERDDAASAQLRQIL